MYITFILIFNLNDYNCNTLSWKCSTVIYYYGGLLEIRFGPHNFYVVAAENI